MIRDFSQYLLTTIEQRLPAHTNLAKELEGVLGLHTSSIYRKLKGEVFFSIEEVLQLSHHYAISLDAFLAQRTQRKQQLQHWHLVQPNLHSPQALLQALDDNLIRYLKKAKVSEPIFWVTDQFPWLLSMQLPFLFNYYLQKTIFLSNTETGEHTQFMPDVRQGIESYCQMLAPLIERLPIHLIIQHHTFINFNIEVSYLADLGFFASEKSKQELLRQYNSFLKAISRQLAKRKPTQAHQWYICRLPCLGSRILLQATAQNLVIDYQYDTRIKYASCPHTFQDTLQQVMALLSHSQCISGENRAARQRILMLTADSLEMPGALLTEPAHGTAKIALST